MVELGPRHGDWRSCIPGASERERLPGVAILVVIAVPLIVLAPEKQPIERLSVRAAEAFELTIETLPRWARLLQF